MIKFDKVTLEPKFIDPSMCFCGGGGGTGGGGTPTKGTNAINRGTVGMSVADMNRRADAQERGSREVANLSAGISDNISPGFGRPDPKGEVAGGFGDYEGGDSFVTSTEAAYRDLDRRAAVGQIPNLSKGFETPIGRIPTPTSAVFNVVNKFGMNRAQDIRDQIRAGGVPVTDRYGRIQGVVSEGTGPVADVLGAFGLNKNVYTGGPGFAPSTSQLMSYRPDPTRQGIASLPYADVQMPTTARATSLSVEPLDRDLMMDALMRGVNNPQSNPQLGTINDPSVTAFNIGRGPMTEDPRAVAEREQILDQVRAAASGEAFPEDRNMYGPGMQDFGPMTPDQLETYQDSSLSPQYGTINDPTAQAGLGSFFTETVPGFFGTTPAQAKSKAKSNADRFKGTNVRTKPTGVGEFGSQIYEAAKNIFTG
tara:strand:- start:439 stop:1707 length:1269 start_codon:yes stop_codon:yes gene_type:complete